MLYQDSSDGIAIATGWEVRGSNLSGVQTGPEAHLVSCTRGTGSSLGVKWPERGPDPLLILAPKLEV